MSDFIKNSDPSNLSTLFQKKDFTGVIKNCDLKIEYSNNIIDKITLSAVETGNSEIFQFYKDRFDKLKSRSLLKKQGDFDKFQDKWHDLFEKNKHLLTSDTEYTGDLNNENKPDGNGVLKYLKTNGVYIGEFKNGVRHGNGIHNWGNGDKYEGMWLNDKRNGRGTFFYNNGNIYNGEWSENNKNGYGIMTFANGDFKDGKWENDTFVEGKVKMIYNNGNSYEGEFNNGETHGYGVYIWKSGEIYEGNFMMGHFSGKAKLTTSEYTYIGNFINGQKSGKGRLEYKNGEFKDGTFKDDNLIEGYENKSFGEVWRYDGEISKGKFHGKGKMYKEGKLVMEGNFVNGNLEEGITNVDVKMEDGTQITGNIKNGNGRKELPNGDYYDGNWLDWEFIEGKVRKTNDKGYVYEGFYKNGDRNGYGKLYEPSGKLMYEGEFRNGSTIEDLNKKLDKIKKFASENSFNENQGFLASLFGKKDDKSEEFYQNIINDNLKSGKLKDAIQNFIYYYLKYIPLSKNNEDLFSNLLKQIKNDTRFSFAYKDLVDIIHDRSSYPIKELWWDKTYDSAIDFLKNEKILKNSNGKDYFGSKTFDIEIVTSEDKREYFEIKKNSFKLYLKADLKNEEKIKKIKYVISVIEETEAEWERWANYRKNKPVSNTKPVVNETKKVENKKDTTIKKSNNEVKENVSNYGRKMKDGRFGEESTAQPGLASDPKCQSCGKKMKQGSKAIATFSSIGLLGKRLDRKQFCTWICAEQHHNK